MNDVWMVYAPDGEANSRLNGSEAIVVGFRDRTRWMTVLLLDGPRASRYWQVAAEHLVVPGVPGLTMASTLGWFTTDSGWERGWYICGHPTREGSACLREVPCIGPCWQHG